MSRRHKFFTLYASVFLAIFGVGAYYINQMLTVRALPDVFVVNRVLPLKDTHLSGKVLLQGFVSGYGVEDYSMTWSVDNGQQNAMYDNAAQNVKQVQIDLSGWNWRGEGPYAITYSAYSPKSGKSATTTFRIYVDNTTPKPQVVSPTPQPSATAPKVTTPQKMVAPSTTAATSVKSWLEGMSFYAMPDTDAAKQAITWQASNPRGAALMSKLAAQPTAQWFGNWNPDVYAAVNGHVNAAVAAQKMPVLVAYNIPQRDCGGFSAGGVGSPQAYVDWISNVARAIGSRKVVLILEPDALSMLDCLAPSDQQARLQMLNSAVNILTTQSAAAVYIDAGHSGWHAPATMAKRLQSANIAQAAGFSLNVSNFMTTSSNIAYGKDVASKVGNKHLVIDTSRNGNGPTSDHQWCNPAGRAVGNLPTTQTGEALVDAFIWAKAPGGSDGTCGPSINGTSAPAAGLWWPEYALQIAENSRW